jgi:hypothetical protein
MAQTVSIMAKENFNIECLFIGFSSVFKDIVRSESLKPIQRIVTSAIKKKTIEPTPTQRTVPWITHPNSLNPRFEKVFYTASIRRVTLFFYKLILRQGGPMHIL